MAEPFEFEIKPKGIDETVRELRGLENQLDDVGESMEGAGGASSNMAQNITAGVVAAQAAYAAITKLAGAVSAAAAEFERQAGIMNRFTGDITEAARRTNGLISQLDLMTAQSRASAAGLTLTADQFATVSVRAAEFAARTGGDATEALNSLIGAIATGRAGQLLQYGVDLQGITSITDKQTAALDGLTSGFEDATSEADTFGGRLQVLSTQMDDATTSAIAVVAEYGAMERGFDNLSVAAVALSGDIGGVSNQLGVMDQAALLNSIHFEMMTEKLSTFAQVLGALRMSGDTEVLAESARQIQGILDGVDSRSAAQRFVEAQAGILGERAIPGDGQGALDDRPGFRIQANFTPSSGGRGRGRGSRNSADTSSPDADTSAQDEITRLIEEQLALEEQLVDNNANKAAIAGELAIIERQRLALLEQQTAEAQKQKQLIIEQREAEEERQSVMRRARRVQDGISQGLDGIASITKKTIQLTEEGGMSAKDAFVTATDEWLKQFAISEAWKGAAAGIEAIGAVIMNAPHAAAKAAEAAGHFALAAAAGGASAAIPNAAGGGSPDSGASRPEASGGQNTGGGGSVIINYNSPTAEAQLGRQQARANRTAQRTFE